MKPISSHERDNHRVGVKLVMRSTIKNAVYSILGWCGIVITVVALLFILWVCLVMANFRS